jgi:hypothetical protein
LGVRVRVHSMATFMFGGDAARSIGGGVCLGSGGAASSAASDVAWGRQQHGAQWGNSTVQHCAQWGPKRQGALWWGNMCTVGHGAVRRGVGGESGCMPFCTYGGFGKEVPMPQSMVPTGAFSLSIKRMAGKSVRRYSWMGTGPVQKGSSTRGRLEGVLEPEDASSDGGGRIYPLSGLGSIGILEESSMNAATVSF